MDKFLTIKEVMSRVGLSRSMIYKLLEHGEFPRPKKIGRLIRWRESVIEAWMDEA